MSIQFFAVLNLKSGIRLRREKFLQLIGRDLLTGRVGQHHDSGFVVLSLPRIQKVIGGGQSGAVVGVCIGTLGTFGAVG